MESLRKRFQAELEIMNGYEEISLRDCSMRVASELIELIIAFMFHHQIPMRVETSKLLSGDKAMLYWATVNRNCVLCGKSNADLAHHYAIGRGANRKKMQHYDYEVLALCRRHHQEQHNIGVKSFDEKYILQDSWIKVDERLNKMLRGVKMIDRFDVGERINERRTRLGMTQKELAIKTDTTKSTVQKWESGMHLPKKKQPLK